MSKFIQLVMSGTLNGSQCSVKGKKKPAKNMLVWVSTHTQTHTHTHTHTHWERGTTG